MTTAKISDTCVLKISVQFITFLSFIYKSKGAMSACSIIMACIFWREKFWPLFFILTPFSSE